MNKQEAVKEIVALRKAGNTWNAIADKLKKAGYVSGKFNRPITAGGAYGMHPDYQGKIKASTTRKKRVAVSANSTTKWDLLKSIEGCSDLPKTTKKSLMQMVFEETVN